MDHDTLGSNRRLTHEELRERQEKVAFELLDIRIFLTTVAFIGTLAEKKRLCVALKEAYRAWKLKLS